MGSRVLGAAVSGFRRGWQELDPRFNGPQLWDVCALVSEVVSGWQPCHKYQHCEANIVISDFIVFARLNNFAFQDQCSCSLASSLLSLFGSL